jgi:ketosteroid isomerase-like protein
MSADLERLVRELCDRQAIRDQLTTYCRAVDRLDRGLLLSVYHADAIDDHGLFVGGPEAFAEWAFSLHAKLQYATQHIITNHSCDLTGDVAHCETYWLFAGMNRQGAPLTIGGGRYVDRFERRAGVWKIAARRCVPEWGGVPGETWMSPEAAAALASGGGIARDRTDLSYHRPLMVEPGRVGYIFEGT